MFTTLEKFGIACISIVGYQIISCVVKYVYNNFLSIALRINAVDLKKTGKWAVVTGATDGIGRAYAELLAKNGLSVVLISRTQEKLEAVANEIAEKYHVETKIIAADFTNTKEIYHDIEKQISSLEIGVLINNVGMSYPYPEYFTDLKSENMYDNIINCNIFSVVNMCKIVLPNMVERHNGVIVNISSLSAQIPSPLLAVYGASKIFVEKFTSDLNYEYKKHGITIQCLAPGYVATNMSKIRSSTWMAPLPSKYVSDASRTIGVREKTTGYYPHTLLRDSALIMDWISPKLSVWVIVRTMENIRSRALKRSVKARGSM